MAKSDTQTIKMAKALRGSLENGCGITVRDFDILIDTMKGKAQPLDWQLPLPHVTRVETIDQTGRLSVTYGVADLDLSIQDDGRTLKLFWRDVTKP